MTVISKRALIKLSAYNMSSRHIEVVDLTADELEAIYNLFYRGVRPHPLTPVDKSTTDPYTRLVMVLKNVLKGANRYSLKVSNSKAYDLGVNLIGDQGYVLKANNHSYIKCFDGSLVVSNVIIDNMRRGGDANVIYMWRGSLERIQAGRLGKATHFSLEEFIYHDKTKTALRDLINKFIISEPTEEENTTPTEEQLIAARDHINRITGLRNQLPDTVWRTEAVPAFE